MRIKRLAAVAAGGALAISLAACGNGNESAVEPESAPDDGGEVSTTFDRAAVEARLEEMATKVSATGPNGEEPSPASVADMTDEQVEEVKAMNLTAAIVMHYGGNDWANAQIAGLQLECEKLGIEIIAQTDANFDPAKQVSDLETVMAQSPDIIFSIPTDTVATAAAYKKAADQGVTFVFMDNVPEGLEAGTDYVSVVSADNYGNGVVSAYLMALALEGEGTIGAVTHEADFFVTAQRWEGFREVIESEFPGIEIVQQQGIPGKDLAGESQAAANAMLTRYPELSGIWAVWDVPAEGVMAAARENGRTDLHITTVDLGTNVAVQLAKGEMIYGLGAQVPFDQGVTEARLAALSFLGVELPPFVALPPLPVDQDNVLEAWEKVYHAPAPVEVQEAFEARG